MSRVTCHASCHVCQNTSPGECAVRMARAGARLLGVNCLFDPFLCLDTLSQMRAGLEAAGGCGHVSRVTVPCPGITGVHLMAQPLGYRTPDVGRYGWVTLPEFPYGE